MIYRRFRYRKHELPLFVMLGIGLIGYFINIIKLAYICCEVSRWLVLRVGGIVCPPLGAVLGYL